MSIYREYLPQLKTTTLFQDMCDEDIISVLDAMQPKILKFPKGEKMSPFEKGSFRVILRTTPNQEIQPRQFKYDMPKFGEPGMIMFEIPTLSRMGDSLPPQKNAKPIHKLRILDYDLEVLEFTENMMTEFYGAHCAAAQGVMLRNLLGILAQKVNDVRHELFLIRDCRDMFRQTDKTLQIFTAGVAMKAVKETAQKWNLTHPNLQAEVHVGGSIDLIRRILSGERCDVLISADDTTIKDMLMPEYAEKYTTFASNKMVVSASEGYDINDDNWKEKLLSDDAVFFHKNPYGDPGGYRGVMALKLANFVEEGLGDKLMDHPGHLGMDPNMTMQNAPEYHYALEYYSAAKSKGVPFANLPDVMNLSDPKLNDTYSKVTFDVDSENTVKASAITHGIAALKTAKFKQEAAEFVEMFLENDFKKYNFIPYNK